MRQSYKIAQSFVYVVSSDFWELTGEQVWERRRGAEKKERKKRERKREIRREKMPEREAE